MNSLELFSGVGGLAKGLELSAHVTQKTKKVSGTAIPSKIAAKP